MTRTTQTSIVSGITSYAYPYAVYGITSSVPVRVWLDKTELEQGFTITYIGREGQADSATAAQIEVDASLLVGKSTITIKGNTATERLSAPFASGAASPSAGLNLDANQRSANLQEVSDAILRSVRFATPYAPSGIGAVDTSILESDAFDASKQYFLSAEGGNPLHLTLSPVIQAILPPHHELPTRAWLASETYEAGEVVFYEGRLYRANAEILPNLAIPPENNDWEGIDGGWRAVVEGGKGYEADDLVLYQGGLYHITTAFISSHAAADLQAQIAANAQHIAPIVATLDSLGLAEANTGKPIVVIGALEAEGYPLIVGTLYPNGDGAMVHSDTVFIPHTPFPDLPTAASLGLASAVLGDQVLTIIADGQGGHFLRLTYNRLDLTDAKFSQVSLPASGGGGGTTTLADLGLQNALIKPVSLVLGDVANGVRPLTLTLNSVSGAVAPSVDLPVADPAPDSLLSPFVFESLGTTGGQASIRLAFTKPDGTEETETIHIDLPAAGAVITAFSLRQTQPADTEGTTGDGIAVSQEAFVPIEIKGSAGWARWLDGGGDAVFLSPPEVAERQDAEWNDGQDRPEAYTQITGTPFDGYVSTAINRRLNSVEHKYSTLADGQAAIDFTRTQIGKNFSFYGSDASLMRVQRIQPFETGLGFNLFLVWTAAAVSAGYPLAIEGRTVPRSTLLAFQRNRPRLALALQVRLFDYTPPTDGEITLSATETDATTGDSRLTLRAHTGLALAAEGNRIVVAKPTETYQQARNTGRIARIASAEHAEIDLTNASPFFTGVFPILGLSFYGGDVRFVGWGDPDSAEPPDTGSAPHEAFVAAAEMGDTTPRIVAYFATPLPDINGSAQTQVKFQTYNASNAVDTNAAFWEALRDAGWDSENLPAFFDIHLAFATNPDATTPVLPTTFESFSTTSRFALIGAVNPYSGEAVYQHTATLGTATEADLRTHFTAEAAPVWCEIKIYPPQPLQSVLLDRPLPSAAIGDRAYDEHPRFPANARKRSGVSHAESLMNYGDTTDYIGTTITPSLTAANEDIATLKAEVALLEAQSDKFSNIPASSLPSPSSPVVLMNAHNGKWLDVLPYPATLSSVGGGSIGIAERFSWLFDRIGQSLGSRFCLYNVDQPQDKGCIGGFKITADGQPGTETYTLSNIKSSDLGAVKYDATQGGNVGDTFLNSVGLHGGGTVKLQIGEQPASLKPYPAALARVLTRQHTPQQWRGELRLEQHYTANDVVLLTDNATRDYDYWRVNSGRLFWTRPRQASDPTGAGDEDFANDYAAAVALLTSRSTKMTHAQVVAYSQIHTDEIWQEPVYSESTYAYAFTRVSQHGFPLPT